MQSTIFALSSGSLPSGIAVIRLSGPVAFNVAEMMCGILPVNQGVRLVSMKDPASSALLDRGLVLGFKKPNSFTGEDVVELHCHGGVATVGLILDVLAVQDGCRHAEAGEFSRRAFENGKLDLTQLEGLADLISAQTEAQRKQALDQSGGSLRLLYDGWREELIRYRALIEAELDFSEEEDVPGRVSDQVWSGVTEFIAQLVSHLDDNQRGEMVRDGYKISLLGPPNAGKSSLLNALAKRDVAIVTSEAGTTRDIVSVNLDIGGVLVIVSDTAGLRDTDNLVEKEGIRRALISATSADLVLWLCPSDEVPALCPVEDALVVRTKSDLAEHKDFAGELSISTRQENDHAGLKPLLDAISSRIQNRLGNLEHSVVTRKRHRQVLELCLDDLRSSLSDAQPLEVRSEFLRLASDQLGRLTGRIDVEDLLDVIFGEFCIGK